MKKLILSIFTILFSFTTGFSQEKNLKDLYTKYINSESYKSYGVSIDTFTDKLNIGDNQFPVSKEGEFDTWIKANILKTKFKDVETAKSEYNALTNLSVSLINTNKDLFGLLAKASNSEILELVTSETKSKFKSMIVAFSPCSDNCINEGVYCMRESNALYASTVGTVSIISLLSGNVLAGGITLIGATINHHIGQRKCARALNKCMENC